MRKLMAVVTLALAAGACAGDSTGPAEDASARLQELAAVGFSFTHVGEPGDPFMARLSQLPGDLALTADQLGRIRALVDEFVAATAADRTALAGLMTQAAEARRAGKTPEEVRAILAGGAEIRTQLQQAERGLRESIMGVLTPAQRAWLNGRTPPRPGPCSTVTEAQRNEISALFAQYEQANAADIALVRSAHDRAAAAIQAGATREQVHAIMMEAREAMARLVIARAGLAVAVSAVLTPEQRAAGCFR